MFNTNIFNRKVTSSINYTDISNTLNEQEGKILLKEKYGSSKGQTYLQAPKENKIIMLYKSKLVITGLFTRIFLPRGYPDSVSKDYTSYQIWDTAQAFCSTITGILATQEVFRSVGVGDNTATPLAATITWVFKNGCGDLGKIFFTCCYSIYLDAYSKKWRLYADIMNDVAMCIEISLPWFPNYTVLALCVSNVLKAVVGVAGGATRVALTQHHAICGNMADVSAKDAAQETAVNLVASFTALLMITIFGNSLFIVIMMMTLHIIFNYLAVRAICLNTLNEQRFLYVIDQYLRQDNVPLPIKANRTEPIISFELGHNLSDIKLTGFQIKVGHSVKDIIKHYPNAKRFQNICDLYDDTNYILMPNICQRIIYILVKSEPRVDDILCAYFHAVLLSIIICLLNNYKLAICGCISHRMSGILNEPLTSAKYLTTLSYIPAKKTLMVIEPSNELMMLVNRLIPNEYNKFRCSLKQKGWDINKHLLMVDEWRVFT